MKAALLREIGQPLSIEEVQIDKPKGHEVLIRLLPVGSAVPTCITSMGTTAIQCQ